MCDSLRQYNETRFYEPANVDITIAADSGTSITTGLFINWKVMKTYERVALFDDILYESGKVLLDDSRKTGRTGKWMNRTELNGIDWSMWASLNKTNINLWKILACVWFASFCNTQKLISNDKSNIHGNEDGKRNQSFSPVNRILNTECWIIVIVSLSGL